MHVRGKEEKLLRSIPSLPTWDYQMTWPLVWSSRSSNLNCQACVMPSISNMPSWRKLALLPKELYLPLVIHLECLACHFGFFAVSLNGFSIYYTSLLLLCAHGHRRWALCILARRVSAKRSLSGSGSRCLVQGRIGFISFGITRLVKSCILCACEAERCCGWIGSDAWLSQESRKLVRAVTLGRLNSYNWSSQALKLICYCLISTRTLH